MNQSPEIPPNCQWAIFLRNHDELTLEMVTDEERDYMYGQYAADPQMRLNVGIRRRLAPLMENSRPRIELMNSLLFTMPGTPIIYYGDEIGMGDNVYLGDRNGVRTPMQWSSDRNAGFSRADPARLYFPVIMDPVYGYEAINVEAQERSPASLLHWMKRLIALRRQHTVFGRGSLEFIRTDNRKVLTYVRRYEDQVVLCVANLARTVQPVFVPVAEFAGLTPVELLGQTQFPKLTEDPLFLTLAPYGFYWFQLQETVVPATARAPVTPEEHAELPAFFAGVAWDSVLDGPMRTLIERQALVPFLQRQRWFGGKARQVSSARLADWTTIRRGAHPAFLAIVEAHYAGGASERYVLPLAMSSGHEADAIERQHPGAVLARISGARKGLLYDGLFDDGTCTTLLATMQEGRELRMKSGLLRATNLALTADRAPADAILPVIRGGADQSNTSVMFDQQLVLKMFRRIEAGPNPDVEITGFLTARGFARVPALAGAIDYHRPGDDAASVVMLQRYVWNQGNGWHVTMEELGRYLERAAASAPPTLPATDARAWLWSGASEPPAGVVESVSTYLATAEILGRRTGELHVELAAGIDPAFAPEPFSSDEIVRAAGAMRQHADEQFALLRQSLPRLDERRRDLAEQVLARAGAIRNSFEGLSDVADGGRRIRCHGDYHLGQVLVTEGDVAILDFEGEPARPLPERRAKWSPLRDVAGMLRSFAYAAMTGLTAATLTRPEDTERLQPWAEFWEAWVSATYLRAYLAATAGAGILPARQGALEALLHGFVVDKAVYELGYELNNRPDWVHVPLSGLLRLGSEPPAQAPHSEGAQPPLHA
jgi:maltose alpha-D-glucosyltransferase/alpha-amylase